MEKRFFITEDLKIENVDILNKDIAKLFKVDNVTNFDSFDKAQKMRDYLDTEVKFN